MQPSSLAKLVSMTYYLYVYGEIIEVSNIVGVKISP